MKGKGKKCRDSDDECPLQFLDFEPFDHARFCPRYTAVLSRTEEEGVGLEELDALQGELEALLVSVTKRQRLVESEMEALVNWQEKPKDKKSSSVPIKIEASLKRTKVKEVLEERPTKKLKESSSNSSSAASSIISTTSGSKSKDAKLKSKNVASKVQDYDFEASTSASHHYRNDIPDRFCKFIEPFCAPIKPENVKMLEDAIKSYDEEGDIYKVPNLGKHYSTKWATLDDSWEAKKTSPRSMEKKKGLSAANSVTGAEKMRNGKRHAIKDKNVDTEKGGFGALTQRLISCLMEEQNSNGSAGVDTSFDSDNDSPVKPSGNNILKGLNLGNVAQVEKRIKKELEENGLLDLDDVLAPGDLSSTEDDEILKELLRCQHELKMVSSHNQSQMKHLLSLAKADLAKQEIKKKLKEQDGEVNEIYRRFVQAKQKKRALTKKEKEQAAKALRDREVLVKQLDSIHAV